jgi:hypothetical protein
MGRSQSAHYLVAHYLTALCVSALGMCGGGWLLLTPFAFGYPAHGREAVTAMATGAGLIAVCLLTMLCWVLAWRRRLRADGVLPSRVSRLARQRAEKKAERSARRQARAERLVRESRRREVEAAPDPTQVLTDLRALLTPLLSAAEEAGEAEVAEVAGEAEEAEVNGFSTAVAEANREVQAPGHLRGTRSASFFALPVQAGPQQAGPEQAEPMRAGPDDSLMLGAELLMVGTGEEESW